ncbi:cytosolic 5'-nucleotidase 1A-like isoform X2 [Scyliorhinus canicula]|uniref:cytosolic 5'-nucleotidase 1A-like isoform X2 n=1 Tax=Scyliorhinus canicula TaxID=7830 RepID=UPI0018F3B504|nr:cytosolic 5'-nucleotidase 1A-like isoform X2 [Scyliorhinus canicula]
MSDTGLYALEDLDICAVPIPERSSSTKRTRGANASTNPMSDRDRNQLQVQLESNPHQAITIAVSSRTLFNMADERAIYESDGLESYVKYQLDHENEPLKKGLAFALMKALETVNFRLHELYPGSDEIFDIVLMTNNHAQVGVRLINSINHYGLSIERFCMTGGTSPINYLKAYHTNLYLSSDPMKVANALSEGIAAATMCHLDKDAQLSEKQLRVAFDGDSFIQQEQEDKSKKDYMLSKSAHDLESKSASQATLVGFLESLGRLQKKFYAKNERLNCPIRIYLIVKKGGSAAGLKALKTIRSWGLDVDEAFILSGLPANELLNKIAPHIYFDEQTLQPTSSAAIAQCKSH